MKRNRGFSIIESMVGIGIVSVVGLGMYTGFSQLNDAVNQNKSLSQATTSQNLLLSLLEADLANHGLGITDAQPACLVDYDASTNTFQSTCDGGLVSVPSPGIVTCRDDPDSTNALLTLTYRVTATELAAANTGPTLTPAQIEAQFAGTSNPLDWVIRHTWTQPNCTDYPSATGLAEYLDNNLPFVGQGIQGVLGKVLEVNVAELSFSNTNGNLNVNFTPNIERVLTTTGNNTSVADIQLQTTADLEAVSLTDQVADLPVVSFPHGIYLLRPSGASNPADIPLEVPVPIFRDSTGSENLTVPFILEEKNSEGVWERISQPGDAYTIRPGQQPSIDGVALNVDRRIRLYSGEKYLLGEYAQATAVSTEDPDSQSNKLKVRMVFPELAVQRAEGAETAGTIMMNRPIASGSADFSLTLRLDNTSCGGDGLSVSASNSYMLNVRPGINPNQPTPSGNFTDCNEATVDTINGDLLLPIVMNNASGPLNSVDVVIMVNASAAADSLTLSLEPNSAVEYEGSPSHTLDIVNSGILPEVNFVQSQSYAIEPVPGEQRGTQLTLAFEPPTNEAMTLVLEDNTTQLTCHPSTGNYFLVASGNTALTTTSLTEWTDPLSDESYTINAASTGVAIGDCVDVGDGVVALRPISVPANTASLEIPVRFLPSAATEHGYNVEFSIAPKPTSYTVGDRNTARITLEEYGRVQFTAASAVVDEDSGAMGWRQETIPLSINPVLDQSLTAYVGIYSGNPTDLNAPSADSPQDIQFASNPQSISIPAGASTAQIIYQIENDVEFDKGKAFFARVERVVGGALPGPTPNPISGMPDNSILMTIDDQDRCAVGAGLTSGQSPANHFYSRGTTLLETADIDGATVRIEDGYDSVNDRLILDGYDGVESGNTVTYTSVDYTYVLRGSNKLFVPNTDVLTSDISQGTYEIDAVYTIEQGVLEIEIDSNPDSGTTIEAPVMVDFLRDIVNYQNIGVGSGNRSVTFTLGNDVQAWDGHEDGTTHYYRYVPFASGETRTWTHARSQAGTTDNQFFGNTGYLATITSEAENQFIQSRFNLGGGNPNGWAGAKSKVTGAGEISDWYWTEGPEGEESNGLGRWWWRGGNGSSNSKSENWIRTDNTLGLSDAACSDTGPDGQPMTGVQRLLHGYSETINSDGDVVPDPVRRYTMWRCKPDGGRQEPNGVFSDARGLKIIGGLSSNQTWNDERQSFNSTQYNKGYYVEYGGRDKSGFQIRNLKLAQTSTFSASSCQVNHGPFDTTCRAWSDLTSGFGVSNTAGDFYSAQNGLTDSQKVVDQPRARVNVYINHENYNPTNDRLVIAGATSTPSVGLVQFAAVDTPDGDFSISGTYFINQGRLQIQSTQSPHPTGAQWAPILNQMVEYQNNSPISASDYSVERSITYTLGDGVAWPYHPDGTTHFYRYVEDDASTWNSARTQALATSTNYYGETGYLATITTEAEHEFLANNMGRPNGAPVTAWLGGTDQTTEGTWVWQDGPEAGVQFWSGFLTNGKPVLSGNGTVDTSFTLPACQAQTMARDGSDHNPLTHNKASSGGFDVYVLDMLQGTTADVSPHRFTKWSCAPNAPDNRPEPSGENNIESPQEDYLILSADARGGQTWNDTFLNGDDGDSWLNPRGYLQEFGGDNEFFNRSTSQTFRIAPEQCAMQRETSSSGCLPGADLSIGTASTSDFYGPGTSVTGALITQARVQIVGGFVSNGISDRDELALRGTNGDLINTNRTRRYEDVPLVNGSNIVDVNGEYDFITGVLRLTAESAVPASAMVAFINQRVQLVAAPGSNTAKDIGFTLGDALVWTGHEDGVTRYYRFVSAPGGTWSSARAGAQSTTQNYFGVPGYLATITSKAENDFIAGSFANQGSPIAGWLGGSDNRSSGTWEWLSGPEGGNTSNSGTSTNNRMQFWDGNSGPGTKPVNLTGSAITTAPSTSGHPMLAGAVGCSANDPACCKDQFPGYHNQTPAQGTAAATALGQTGTVLTHHFFGYTESQDSMGNVTVNTGKRFANWACNGGTPQPSDSSIQNFLLITGSPLGNGMWNDVQDSGITSAADIYYQQGYYVEYGGGAVNGGGTWSHNFNDRRIGRVVRVPQGCAVPDSGFQRVE